MLRAFPKDLKKCDTNSILDSVFRKDMEYEKLGELHGSDGVIGRDEDCLFRQSIYDYQNCSKT